MRSFSRFELRKLKSDSFKMVFIKKKIFLVREKHHYWRFKKSIKLPNDIDIGNRPPTQDSNQRDHMPCRSREHEWLGWCKMGAGSSGKSEAYWEWCQEHAMSFRSRLHREGSQIMPEARNKWWEDAKISVPKKKRCNFMWVQNPGWQMLSSEMGLIKFKIPRVLRWTGIMLLTWILVNCLETLSVNFAVYQMTSKLLAA